MSALWQNHIAYWRKLACMSQEALALGLEEPTTKGTISQYESGKRTPSIERLTEMARVLGRRPGELIDGPSPMPSASQLEAMVERAMKELPVGATLADFPRPVAASLHAQLRLFQSDAVYRDDLAAGTSPDAGAQSPAPTKRGARVAAHTP